MTPSFGTATVVRLETGSLVVAGRPDKTIGVHASLYDEMLPGHRHGAGMIQLDCAGHYRYHLIGKDATHPEILIFELLPDAAEHFGHHPQSHGRDVREITEEQP